jgi:hypothetical protein
MREEVSTIVRAAVAEALASAQGASSDRERALEARIAQLESEAKKSPHALTMPMARAPSVSTLSRAPIRVSVPPGASTYGVAIVDPGPTKPELDLAAVGPVEVDFGGPGRALPKVIAALVVLLLLGLVTVTLLSHA